MEVKGTTVASYSGPLVHQVGWVGAVEAVAGRSGSAALSGVADSAIHKEV